MHMIPSKVNGKYVIRFCVTYEHATESDISEAWEDIKLYSTDILKEVKVTPPLPPKIAEPSDKQPKKRPLTRAKSLRFSFTRSISKEIFENQSEHLRDGSTPILVIETDDLEQSLIAASANNKELDKITDIDSDEHVSN